MGHDDVMVMMMTMTIHCLRKEK